CPLSWQNKWEGPEEPMQYLRAVVARALAIQVCGLQLEGCSFDGARLSENRHDSPSVSAVPACYMAWIVQCPSGSYGPEEVISLPVYTSSERVSVVTHVTLPCGGNPDQWIQNGAALSLKQQ
ncbi:cytoplasmic dynein 2 heavy chain 1, partial [Salvelinus sp. IW2-2015]|uniref:cytoplasmic dynein 2 heavy chain 1 n=1 Tax=Salvelinus sp. IW2-2015 TaxID=2691554 RepID=UPI000CEB1098